MMVGRVSSKTSGLEEFVVRKKEEHCIPSYKISKK